MPFEHIMLPSAGSLAVAAVAAFISSLQIWFSTKRAEFRWYRWTAAVSFATILYAVGIFLEYNAPEGPINRFGGLLEWTAVIFLVHALYGLVFSRLNAPSRRYHSIAGGLHLLILVLLWTTPIFVSDHFVAHHFLTLEKPFVEAGLSPLGPVFVLYTLGASINAIRLWIVRKKEKEMHSCAFVWGASFWILLGAHDGAVAIGLLSFQYIMEYGFLGFSAALLYGMLSDYLRTSDALKQSNNTLRKEMKLRERSDEALRESEKRLRTAQSIAKIGNWSWNIISGKTEWSDQAYEIFKAPHKEPSYEVAKSFVHTDDLDLWQNTVQHALQEQKAFSLDYRAVRSDGKTIWVHHDTQTVFNEQGKLTGYKGTLQDITERKQAEEALKKSVALHKEAQRVARIGHWELEADIGTPVWSEEIFRIFGLEPCEGEPSFTNHETHVHPEDWPILEKAVRQAGSEGTPFDLVFRMMKPGGEIGWMHVIGTTSQDNKGHVTKLFGTAQDITALRRTEDHLEKYQNIVSSTSDGISLLDEDYRYIIVNDTYERFSGIKREQLLGRTVADYLGEDAFHQVVKPHFDRCLQGEIVTYKEWFEYHALGKKFIEITYSPYRDTRNHIAGVVCNARDMTEYKRVEEMLQESEKSYRLITKHLNDIIWQLDTNLQFVCVSPSVERVLGLSIEEALKMRVTDIIDKDGIAQMKKHIEARPRSAEESAWPNEYKMRHKDGHWVDVEVLSSPVYDSDGHQYGFVGVTRDITKRKWAEEALRKSEEKYRSLVESTADHIYLIDKDCNYLFMNRNHLQHIGLEPNSVVGRSYAEFHSQEEASEFREKLNQVLTTVKSYRYIHESQRDKGHYLRTLSPVKDMQGNVIAVTVVSKDVTEMIQAEESLRQVNAELLREYKQRKLLSRRLIELLESDRRQTAMELHDHVGHTLTSLKMTLEVMHEQSRKNRPDLTAQIEDAEAQTIRVIRDIKAISHGLKPGTLETLGIVSSIRDLCNEIQRHTDISIHFFTRNVPHRFASHKELAVFRIAQEGITNVVNHAGAKHVFVNLIHKGESLFLSVEDDGAGFDPEAAIKPGGEMRPFGLLIMRERAVLLGGEFTVESQAGRGTCLMAEIPI